MTVRVTILLVALVLNGQTRASLIIYGDRDEWLEAVPSATTIDFVGIPAGTPITDQYSSLGVVFSSTLFTPSAIGGSGLSDGAGIRGEVDIVMDFDVPVYAVAIDTIQGGALGAIEFFDESNELIEVLNGPSTFGGYVSDVPIARIRLLDGLGFPSFADNILFGPPIPTPGALPLLGVALLGGARRRRR